MEKIIGLKELRQNVARYARKVRAGESFVVVKRSEPLFKITPIEDETWETVVDFTKIKKGGVDIKEVMDWTEKFIARYRPALEALSKK